MRRAIAILALLLVAADEPVPVRAVDFKEQGKFLTMTVATPDVVDEGLRKRIRSGFASTIILRVYLFRESNPTPLGLTVRTYRVWYDLWDELYFVQMQDPLGQRSLKFKTEGEALAQLTKLDTFPLAPLSLVPLDVRHYVAVLIEVNPISPELLAQARRWLAHPGSSERLSGGETFFGSFVSVFVNTKISDAERVVRFKSQPFMRTEVKPK